MRPRHPRFGAGRRGRAAVLALLGAAVVWSPAFLHWDATGHGDWQQFQHQWEVGWVAALRHGELALWNPHHCGGVFLYGDPQAQVYSPLFWALLPLGTTLGLKVFVVLHCAVGLWGMAALVRRRAGATPAVAGVAALLWGASGFFAWHGSGGHSAFLPFYFLPALLLAWERAIDDLRWAAVVALLLAWTVFEGGVYPFPYFCVALAVEGLARASDPRQAGRVVRAGAAALALAALLGAFRFLPILRTIADYPRATRADDAVTFAELLDMLTAREHAYRWHHEFLWAEYGAFVGWGTLVFGAVGLVVALRGDPVTGRRRLRDVAGLLVFGGLTLGAGSPWHPWTLLHALPVYGSLRVPSRFAVLLTFYLVILAALGLRVVFGWLRRRRLPPPLARARSAAPALVLGALLADLAHANLPIIDRWREPPLPGLDAAADRYHLLPSGEYARYASFPALGVGNPGCYTGIEPYHAARGLWTGPGPQQRVSEGRGDVREVHRTTNTLQLDADLATPATITWNQTWARGWRTDVGEVGPDALGRVALRLPAGRHHVTLRYLPDELLPGLAASGVGLVATVALWARGRRRARRAAEPR